MNEQGKWEGATLCPLCKRELLETEAMTGPDGQLIHEACYEPGDTDN